MAPNLVLIASAARAAVQALPHPVPKPAHPVLPARRLHCHRPYRRLLQLRMWHRRASSPRGTVIGRRYFAGLSGGFFVYGAWAGSGAFGAIGSNSSPSCAHTTMPVSWLDGRLRQRQGPKQRPRPRHIPQLLAALVPQRAAGKHSAMLAEHRCILPLQPHSLARLLRGLKDGSHSERATPRRMVGTRNEPCHLGLRQP